MSSQISSVNFCRSSQGPEQPDDLLVQSRGPDFAQSHLQRPPASLCDVIPRLARLALGCAGAALSSARPPSLGCTDLPCPVCLLLLWPLHMPAVVSRLSCSLSSAVLCPVLLLPGLLYRGHRGVPWLGRHAGPGLLWVLGKPVPQDCL